MLIFRGGGSLLVFLSFTCSIRFSYPKVATLSLIVALASGAPQIGLYNGDPSLAKILQEQRFNVGNNKFGHATQQEDGVAIKEESTGNNNRIGQYQYVGDDGKTYTVKYEAGVNGFR